MKLRVPYLLAVLCAAAPATPVAPWTYVSPSGARSGAIENAGDRLLLGTAQGLHQSFDGGTSWSRVPGFGNPGRTLRIVANPHAAGHWYAMIQQTNTAYDADGVFQTWPDLVRSETRDGGATWQRLSFDNPNVTGMPAFHPTVNHALAWNTYYTWRYSSDGGTTWLPYTSPDSIMSAVGLPLPGNPFGAITYTEDVAGNSFAFRVSTAGGSGWSAPIAPFPATPGTSYQPVLETRRVASSSVLWSQRGTQSSYAGTVDFSTGAVVSFPSTAGALFRVLDDPLQAGAIVGLVQPVDYGCSGCERYNVAGLAPGAAQWQTRGSIDVGDKYGTPETPRLLHSSGSRLWATDPSTGVRISDDGGNTWSVRNAGLDEALVNAVLIDPRNPQVLVAGRDMQSLQRSVDGGATWADVGGQVPRDVRALARSPVDPDHVVATAAGGVYRSRDAGATWQHVPTALAPAANARGWRGIAWCAHDDNRLVVEVDRALYRSADAGATWTIVVDRPASPGPFGVETASVAPGRIYFSDNASAWRVSTDCGATSTLLADVTAVFAVDPNDSAHIVAHRAGVSDYAVSTDGGQTWIHTTNPVQEADSMNVMEHWIDACLSSRFTTSRLLTMSGTADGLTPEPPALGTWLSDVRAVDSRCNGTTSYNVVATSAGGLWVSVANLDAVFADGFEPVR